MKAEEFLETKGIKDTIFDSNEPNDWRKGGLSELLGEYANQAFDLDVVSNPFKIMEWIDVKTRHFADIEKTDNGYRWESNMIGEPFMVAVPTNKGWCIQQVILTEEIGLQCYTDDDGGTYFGWEITDVTHWFKPEEPEQ